MKQSKAKKKQDNLTIFGVIAQLLLKLGQGEIRAHSQDQSFWGFLRRETIDALDGELQGDGRFGFGNLKYELQHGLIFQQRGPVEEFLGSYPQPRDSPPKFLIVTPRFHAPFLQVYSSR